MQLPRKIFSGQLFLNEVVDLIQLIAMLDAIIVHKMPKVLSLVAAITAKQDLVIGGGKISR